MTYFKTSTSVLRKPWEKSIKFGMDISYVGPNFCNIWIRNWNGNLHVLFLRHSLSCMKLEHIMVSLFSAGWLGKYIWIKLARLRLVTHVYSMMHLHHSSLVTYMMSVESCYLVFRRLEIQFLKFTDLKLRHIRVSSMNGIYPTLSRLFTEISLIAIILTYCTFYCYFQANSMKFLEIK